MESKSSGGWGVSVQDTVCVCARARAWYVVCTHTSICTTLVVLDLSVYFALTVPGLKLSWGRAALGMTPTRDMLPCCPHEAVSPLKETPCLFLNRSQLSLGIGPLGHLLL